MNRERTAELEKDWLKTHKRPVQPVTFKSPEAVTGDKLRKVKICTPATLAVDWNPEPVMKWFVDATGLDDSGSAIPFDEFIRRVQNHVREYPTHGYGLVGVGQFQVYVGAFKPA